MVNNAAILLESLVRDRDQRQRLLALMATNPYNPYPDATPLLVDFLRRIRDPMELERLINEAGLKALPDPDAYRLARALEFLGPGRRAIADMEGAIQEQKDFDNKLLYGRRADPGSDRIIGAHSPRIVKNPDYQILSRKHNVDGTIKVQLKKLLSSGPPSVWSRTKNSTLAPHLWRENQIFWAGEMVAKTAPVFVSTANGIAYHRDTIDGVSGRSSYKAVG